MGRLGKLALWGVAGLVVLGVSVPVAVYAYWHFVFLQSFEFQPLPADRAERLAAPPQRGYAGRCVEGISAERAITLNVLNLPSERDLEIVIEITTGSRSRLLYRGPATGRLTLEGVGFCDQTMGGRVVRSYNGLYGGDDRGLWGDVSFYLIDEAAGEYVFFRADAKSPLLFAEEASVEFYPYYRADVEGRYALRVDKAFDRLPEGYDAPRLYRD